MTVEKFIQKVNEIRNDNPGLVTYVDRIIGKNEPNFWEIIEYGTSKDKNGRSAHETRYSRMIKWLLDPTENHNLGHFFVEELLKFASKKQDNKKDYSLEFSQDDTTFCKCEEKFIDVYYRNETRNLQIAIEVKQYSSEHNAGKENISQLEKYETLVNSWAEGEKVLLYLTPSGEEASEKSWINMSYAELSEILELTLSKSTSLDFCKIVKDFKEDLARTSATVDFETFKTGSQEVVKEIKEELLEYSDLEEDSEEYLALLMELNRQGINRKAFLETVNILVQSIYKQDHTPNEFSQKVMRKILNYYAVEEINIEEIVPKEKRLQTVKSGSTISDLIKKIRITNGKGQGINFIVDAEKEIIIYMSADKDGKIFNDDMQFTNKQKFEKFVRVKSKDFQSAEEVYNSEEKFMELINFIEKQIEENIELLK